ncbi:HpcH/HpaI aldolase/citrate lyase family protein [Novosphingopyxis sp.]|uniref:HpcH/HpaI aldolase/citrate lyase family protein n=1 Tax=Novosphingopyxis sp. TaxID=2709690 RepID=UPI003B5AEDA0
MTAEAGPKLHHVRSALFVPGGRQGALDKAAGLAADMIVVDLEDAVAPDAKRGARAIAADAIRGGFGGDKLIALRINAAGTDWHNGDLELLDGLPVDYAVLPKVGDPDAVDALNGRLSVPVLAMIETAAAIYAARAIAAMEPVAGLLAGTNDLALDLGVRAGPGREGLELALQTIVLAGAAARKPVFDGVCNRLDDADMLERQCVQGRAYGFTGKTLIHPGQIETANRLFAPDEAELDRADALIEASKGGAARFRGEMIEDLHVIEARKLLARAGRRA